MTKITIETDDEGTIHYYNEVGEYHREDGPAVEYMNGYKEWWVNGKEHRTDGPAVIYGDGSFEWWVNGLLHREDGPARELTKGHKEWWVNGKQHRIDGPALEYDDGSDREWWIDDVEYTEEEFNNLINSLELEND